MANDGCFVPYIWLMSQLAKTLGKSSVIMLYSCMCIWYFYLYLWIWLYFYLYLNICVLGWIAIRICVN